MKPKRIRVTLVPSEPRPGAMARLWQWVQPILAAARDFAYEWIKGKAAEQRLENAARDSAARALEAMYQRMDRQSSTSPLLPAGMSEEQALKDEVARLRRMVRTLEQQRGSVQGHLFPDTPGERRQSPETDGERPAQDDGSE